MSETTVISILELRENRLLTDVYNRVYGKQLSPLEFIELGNSAA
jgi:hypothetical protein